MNVTLLLKTLCLSALLVGSAAGAPPANEFFAMDTAMVRKLGTPLERPDLEMLAAMGYAGVGPVALDEAGWRHLTGTVLPLLDELKLKLFAVYTSNVRVDRESFAIGPEIKQGLPALKGRRTLIWLPVTSKEFRPSDPAGDDLAVAAVREVADRAAEYGLSVALYPHTNNLIERVEDAVRIAVKSGRPNVGVTFNLCHWLRTDGTDLESTLKLALPHLLVVTINGADTGGKDWGHLIQPLDAGTFNVEELLRELKRLGYRGPIGLQGYSVAEVHKMEPAENLRRSMKAWKKFQVGLE